MKVILEIKVTDEKLQECLEAWIIASIKEAPKQDRDVFAGWLKCVSAFSIEKSTKEVSEK